MQIIQMQEKLEIVFNHAINLYFQLDVMVCWFFFLQLRIFLVVEAVGLAVQETGCLLDKLLALQLGEESQYFFYSLWWLVFLLIGKLLIIVIFC